MNINEMSDQEKSGVLARLCGWSIVEFVQYYDYRLMDAENNEIGSFPDWYQTDGDMPDLYNPENMALAWRVLNWAWNDLVINFWFKHIDVGNMPPADAQRAWLDKILTLALEAGMVTK